MLLKRQQFVAFVPSWASAALKTKPDLPASTMMSMTKLMEASILSPKDVCFYYFCNNYINSLTNNIFHDMTSMLMLPDNQAWKVEHHDLLAKHKDAFVASSVRREMDAKVKALKNTYDSAVYFTPEHCDDMGILLVEEERPGSPSTEETQVMVSNAMAILTWQLSFDVSKQFAAFEWITVHGK